MAKRITLKEVQQLLEKGHADTDLLKDIDAVMGLIVFFAPLAAGLPPGTANLVVEVLGEREALVKAGERLIERLAKLCAGDEVDRYRRIEAAHLLIIYSAFFDAVSKRIPDLWKKLALDEQAQKYLTRQASSSEKENLPVGPPPPDVPHPLTTFYAHEADLQRFYQALSRTLAGFLDVLKIVEINAESKANEYNGIKEFVVADSVERYKAQYVELAKKFPEFHIFSNFHFFADVTDNLRGLAEATSSCRDEIDLGFQKLSAAIASLGRQQASRTVAELRKRYEKNSEKPISEKGVPGLTFPRRCDIFLPQAYRAVRYRAGMHLDDEETWRSVEVSEDLGPFLTRCLESPFTMQKPILILGAPGSGKSLLTHMIGSVLGSRFDTIRVELNKVHADSRVHSQIKDFVSLETKGRSISWPELRDEFTAPPVVILDGFDELLQATGKVFAAYLEDCEQFQVDNLDVDRPVRTIVTSRDTLINRAHVPEDTIVVRLEEFDENRRLKWNAIWNYHNQNYFLDPTRNTRPFDVTTLHPDVLSLAKQPLLLLMLALYDANQNRLATRGEWNRTALYYNLIREFVEREEKRAEDFDNLPAEEQNERINRQMQRLGAAGLSMFNRRKREIRRNEVEEILAIFQLTYSSAKDGQLLSQSERLFGSFFFVVKSETTQSSDMAYEFLHPTFGEFLAAYMISTELVENCENLMAQKLSARREYIKKPDSFPNTWFECLMHAPLFSEPVVLAMFREWLPQTVGKKAVEIVQQLKAIVLGQAIMLLEGARFPDSFKALPALGHAALYSANLIVLAAVLEEKELIFEESDFKVFPDETRPWDRLTNLWRSWFSLRVLANLGTVFAARRDGDRICIRASNKIEAHKTQGVGLDRLYTAASGLGDNVLLGLSGYFLADATKDSQPTLDEVDAYLKTEGYTFGVFSNFRRIPLDHGPESYRALMAIVRDAAVPNWEIWLRAIWILTANSGLPVSWSSIPTVREQHRLCDHLIASVASPKDADAFYSVEDLRPTQLIFAKRSGGPKRYRETYERLLKILPDAKWSMEGYVAMQEAAAYFGDRETSRGLTKNMLARALAHNTSTLENSLIRLIFRLGNNTAPELWNLLSVSGPDIWLPSGTSIFRSSFFRSRAIASGFSSHKTLSSLLGRRSQSALDNPYLPGYAQYLRTGKLRADFVAPIMYLITCMDLPVDVQIELLDAARRMDGDQKTELAHSKFPLDRVGEITLESLAAARLVAKWLGDERAAQEIERRVASNYWPQSPTTDENSTFQ